MRVLSPRMEPPLRSELGSMASTANRWPSEVTMFPIASMKVDFPAPGTPVMPMRTEFPERGRQRSIISCACSVVFGKVAFDEGDGLRQYRDIAGEDAFHILGRRERGVVFSAGNGD